MSERGAVCLRSYMCSACDFKKKRRRDILFSLEVKKFHVTYGRKIQQVKNTDNFCAGSSNAAKVFKKEGDQQK